MVILDTSIIIDHLRLTGKQDSVLDRIVQRVRGDELVISTITIQELFRGKSILQSQSLEMLYYMISLFRILPYSFEVAQKGGEIGRDKKSIIEFADAAIAATAIINQARLATLNPKDFRDISGLEMFQL